MKEQLASENFPTRVFISIDLKNMFNRMSRRRCHAILCRSFPHLLSVFDALYKKPNKIWYIRADGTKDYLLQIKGFVQGCPLSLLFAALVLSDLLSELSARFKERAAACQEAGQYTTCNDKQGGLCDPLAFVDDAYIFPVLEDTEWAMDKINELGPAIGAELNTDKTTMLTSITGESVIDRLPDPELCQFLDQVLSKYCKKGKNTTGIRTLGYPLGSSAFIEQHLEAFHAEYRRDAISVTTKLPDLHTAAQTYTKCIPQCAPYQMTADVLLAAATTDYDTVDAFNRQSRFAKNINTTTTDVLSALAALDGVTNASVTIAMLPESLKGLGIYSPTRSAVSSFLVLLARSIRYAERGIRLGLKTASLSPYLTTLFKDWRTSSVPMFRHYREMMTLAGALIKQPKAFP